MLPKQSHASQTDDYGSTSSEGVILLAVRLPTPLMIDTLPLPLLLLLLVAPEHCCCLLQHAPPAPADPPLLVVPALKVGAGGLILTAHLNHLTIRLNILTTSANLAQCQQHSRFSVAVVHHDRVGENAPLVTIASMPKSMQLHSSLFGSTLDAHNAAAEVLLMLPAVHNELPQQRLARQIGAHNLGPHPTCNTCGATTHPVSPATAHAPGVFLLLLLLPMSV